MKDYPLHIMHVIDSLALGGAERMLVEIANATEKSRYRVSVCVTRSNTALASELKSGIPFYTLNRASRFSYDGVRKLANIVRNDPVSLFHVHGRSSFSFLSYASFLAGIKGAILLHDHDGWIETTPTLPLWFRLIARLKADYYVGVHEQMRNWAQQSGIPEKHASFIGNALDLTRFSDTDSTLLRSDFGISANHLLGVWVGGIRRQKGLIWLIDALHACQPPPELKILIVGSINEPEYYQMCVQKIAAYGLEDVFVFTGARMDIPLLIKMADFALLSSLSESGPLVLIEYLAGGLPVVAVETGSISHQVAQAGIPGFVKSGDMSSYSRGLNELFHLTRQERIERGAAGKKLAFEHYDIHRVMSQWYLVYEKALGMVSR